MTRSNRLSKREREVVEFLLQGKSNKQIALSLGISESTVEFHLKNVYAKLQVNSRVEAILKLGKSSGLIGENLRESTVEWEKKISHTGGMFILWRQWRQLIRESVSTVKKDIEMKNRLIPYSLFGSIFGLLFWFYFSAIGKLVARFSIDAENALAIWGFLSIEFLLIFGVWLIPTLIPMTNEFRRSQNTSLSVVAVIVSWVSAVLGYYLIYVVLLAFIGLPQMEYYLVFGQRGPNFWQDWAELFPRLILYKFLQWSVVSIVIGGLAALATSSIYSFWLRKTRPIMSA